MNTKNWLHLLRPSQQELILPIKVHDALQMGTSYHNPNQIHTQEEAIVAKLLTATKIERARVRDEFKGKKKHKRPRK